MDVVDAMACVDTVKDDDGNDTYRPTEEAAITINSVTITPTAVPWTTAWTLWADIRQYMQTRPRKFGRYAKVCGGGLSIMLFAKASPSGEAVTEGD